MMMDLKELNNKSDLKSFTLRIVVLQGAKQNTSLIHFPL